MRSLLALVGLLAVGAAAADDSLPGLDYGDLHISGSRPLFASDETRTALVTREGDPHPDTRVVLAANGGGYRAASYTAGVMLALGAIAGEDGVSLLEEVDAFSTVSGGGFPVLQYLERSRAEDDCGPQRSGYVSVERTNCEPHDPGGALGDLRANLDRQALFRARPKRVVAALRGAGFDDALTLAQLTDDPRAPGWIPNSSLAPDGTLLPITADRVVLRSGEALPASLALMASSAVPGAIQPVAAKMDGTEDVWLMDGAWADRLGLLSALDLVTSGEVARRVVLVLDSRPQPQFDRDLVGAIEGERLGKGAPGLGRITRRTQLIGVGIELSRYRADAWLLGQVFGRWTGALPREAQVTLRAEGYERCRKDDAGTTSFDEPYCAPDRFGSASTVNAHRGATTPVEVNLLRLGTDTLLQPEGWGEAYQTAACERVAARLFTVLALQPTDLSLTGPLVLEQERAYRASGWVPNTNERPLYPYSDDGATAATRQAALVAAGVLNVLLHLDPLSEQLGLQPDDTALTAAQERLSAIFREAAQVNFRSHTGALDWHTCTGVDFSIDNRWENEDHINDNCECRAVVGGEEHSFLMHGETCASHEAVPDPKDVQRPDACRAGGSAVLP